MMTSIQFLAAIFLIAGCWINSVSAQSIQFVLVDASSNEDIHVLQNNAKVNTLTLGKALNIRAEVMVGGHDSVDFYLDGSSEPATESVEPYAFAGDYSGDYDPWSLDLGSHTIDVYVRDANGNTLDQESITFELVYETPATILLEAESGQIFGPINIKSDPGRTRTMAWDSVSTNPACYVACAKYPVKVEETGYYSLEILTRADTPTAGEGHGVDVFFGDIENKRWKWFNASSWNWVRLDQNVFLTKGITTLTLDLYRPHVEIDQIRIKPISLENRGSFVVEGKLATQISSPFVVGVDNMELETSLYASNDDGLNLGSENGGEARFRVLVQRPGLYRLKVSAKSFDVESDHDSIFVSMGHLSDEIWEMDLKSDQYSWQNYPSLLQLSPGFHEIIVRGRESFTYINRIALEWLPDSFELFSFEAEHTPYLENGMSLLNDADASSNQSIYAELDGSESFYKLYAAKSGDYQIKVLARNLSSDGSLSGSVDGNWIGSVTLGFSEDFSWYDIEAPVSLESSSHDIVFVADSGLEIDKVLVSRVGEFGLAMGSESVYATTVDGVSGFSVVDNALVATQAHQGYAEFNFVLAEKGVYRLKALVKAVNSSSNSFYLTIGNLNDNVWHLPVDASGKYSWVEFASLVNLKVGNNKLIVGGRESGTGIKSWKLELVENTPNIPEVPLIGGGTSIYNSIDALNQALTSALSIIHK